MQELLNPVQEKSLKIILADRMKAAISLTQIAVCTE